MSVANGGHQIPAERTAKRLATLVPIYIASCRSNMTMMTQALDKFDYETVAILGHNLRGSGGGFGFPTITDIGAGLEREAENGDYDKICILLTQLSDFLEDVENSST